jgi:hypothetical protein
MTLATIVLGALVGLAGVEDPRDLVDRLGAPRFADREAAANALRDLGADALPALREGRDADDPEVAARAGALVEQIETNLMVQPTTVRLDYRDRTLAEVAADLGARGGFELKLQPENDPRWHSRRVTLQSSGPVPLWRAIEDLCREGGFQVNQSFQMIGVGGQANRQPVINLMAANSGYVPADVRGPFRIAPTRLDYQRARVFNPAAPQAGGLFVPANGMVVRMGPNGLPAPPGGPPAAVPGVAQESFSLQLELLAEPRMSIVQDGPLKLIEAVDDKGQSLVPPEANEAMYRYAAYNGMNPNGSTNLQLPLALSMPAEPGKKIGRLKATVPVKILARKEPPMVVPLDQTGKAFQNPEATIQVHGVKRDPNQPFTLIELTVKLGGPAQEDPTRANAGAEMLVFRSNNGGGPGQVEIYDAEGRPYPQWFPFTASSGPDGVRMTLRLMPAQDVGPPAEIRYYEMSRASTDVTFELRDVPMP